MNLEVCFQYNVLGGFLVNFYLIWNKSLVMLYGGRKCIVLCHSHFYLVEIWSDFRHLLSAYYVAHTGHTTMNKLTLLRSI